MSKRYHSKEENDEPVSKWFLLALLAIVIVVFYVFATMPITNRERDAYVLRIHH